MPSLSITGSPGPASAAPTVADPELQRLNKQLSDCVNCESAQTPEGLANINRLRAQIRSLQAAAQQAVAVPLAGAPGAAADPLHAARTSMVSPIGGFVDLRA